MNIFYSLEGSWTFTWQAIHYLVGCSALRNSDWSRDVECISDTIFNPVSDEYHPWTHIRNQYTLAIKYKRIQQWLHGQRKKKVIHNLIYRTFWWAIVSSNIQVTASSNGWKHNGGNEYIHKWSTVFLLFSIQVLVSAICVFWCTCVGCMQGLKQTNRQLIFNGH